MFISNNVVLEIAQSCWSTYLCMLSLLL